MSVLEAFGANKIERIEVHNDHFALITTKQKPSRDELHYIVLEAMVGAPLRVMWQKVSGNMQPILQVNETPITIQDLASKLWQETPSLKEAVHVEDVKITISYLLWSGFTTKLPPKKQEMYDVLITVNMPTEGAADATGELGKRFAEDGDDERFERAVQARVNRFEKRLSKKFEAAVDAAVAKIIAAQALGSLSGGDASDTAPDTASAGGAADSSSAGDSSSSSAGDSSSSSA